jgi:2,4-dienoyl-CoA reductase-like NADH-dependent reductase (Old Yellow Enzyme family)
MDTQKRSNNSCFTQESTRPITQVALCARVSTLNNQDPEMQLAELREYAGRGGWQVVEEFTDQGVSGCKESQAQHIIATGQADIILLARELLRDPNWPLRAAHVLKQQIAWPKQIRTCPLLKKSVGP